MVIDILNSNWVYNIGDDSPTDFITALTKLQINEITMYCDNTRNLFLR